MLAITVIVLEADLLGIYLEAKVLKENDALDTDLNWTPENDALSDPDMVILCEVGAIILGVVAKLLDY